MQRFKRSRGAAAAAIGLVAVAAGRASEPNPAPLGVITLTAALTRARMQNPELRAAAQEVEIARSRVQQARVLSPFNPEIGGEGAHRERNEPGESGSVVDFSISLSQQIELGGQRGARIQEAEQHLARAEAMRRDQHRVLDAEVQRAFFQVIANQRRVELLRAIEALGQRVRAAAVARVQAGESPALEANLATIRFADARRATLAAEADGDVALSGLRRLLDIDQGELLTPTGELRPALREVSVSAAIDHALATRADLVAATREVERAAAEQDLVGRLAIPNPTIEIFHRQEERGPDRVTGAGVRIPLPIFDRRSGERAGATARVSQARLQVAGLRRTVEQDVVNAVRRLDAARRTVAVYDGDVLERMAESYGFVETSYRAGKLDLFQAVVVQNELATAQLASLDALVRLREAAIDLERAVGAPLSEVMP